MQKPKFINNCKLKDYMVNNFMAWYDIIWQYSMLLIFESEDIGKNLLRSVKSSPAEMSLNRSDSRISKWNYLIKGVGVYI